MAKPGRKPLVAKSGSAFTDNSSAGEVLQAKSPGKSPGKSARKSPSKGLGSARKLSPAKRARVATLSPSKENTVALTSPRHRVSPPKAKFSGQPCGNVPLFSPGKVRVDTATRLVRRKTLLLLLPPPLLPPPPLPARSLESSRFEGRVGSGWFGGGGRVAPLFRWSRSTTPPDHPPFARRSLPHAAAARAPRCALRTRAAPPSTPPSRPGDRRRRPRRPRRRRAPPRRARRPRPRPARSARSWWWRPRRPSPR